MNILDVVKKAGRTCRPPVRKGRGPASGKGKTAGRGTKGLGARSGPGVPAYYEGGATPTFRRFPKRGFNNKRFQVPVEEVNVGALRRFEEGSTVGPEELVKAGLIEGRGLLKILGKGTLDKALTVRAHRFSAGARRKIEDAGGKAVEMA